MTDHFAVRMLRDRLNAERLSMRRSLITGMQALQDRLISNLKRVQDGEHVDAHLIVNAAMLTEEIARWNLTLDLSPFLELQDGHKDPTPTARPPHAGPGETAVSDEPPPLPPLFAVGAWIVYIGDRVLTSGDDRVRLHPGLEVLVTEARPGRRGTSEVLPVDDDGEPVVDRTEHGSNVWVNALGQRGLIRADTCASEWRPKWGPYLVGDVVVPAGDRVSFTGIVRAASLRWFTVLWEKGAGGRYSQDCQGIRRFVIGIWGDQEAERAALAERRAQLEAYHSRGSRRQP